MKNKQSLLEIMADLEFSGKRLMNSLSLRILLVCFGLLIIPLFIHGVIVYVQEYRNKGKELLKELNLFGQAEKDLVNRLVYVRVEQLATMELLIDFSKPSGALSQVLKSVAEKETFSSLFYLVLQNNGTAFCKASSEPAMVGKILFSKQAVLAQQNNFFVFGEKDPITGLKQFYIAKANRSGGILVMGVPAQTLIELLATLKGSSFPYHLSFAFEDGEIFVRDDPHFIQSQFHILPKDDFEHSTDIRHLFSKEHEYLAYAIPLNHSSLMLLIDISEQAVLTTPIVEVLIHLPIFFALIFVIGGLGTWLITRRIARPLEALSQTMQRVGKGDLKARYLSDKMGFELNTLGERFNQTIDSLVEHMNTAKSERLAKESLASELRIGHEIQHSLFPKAMPDLPGFDIAAGFDPAKEVAGDFYDLFKRDGQVLIAIADASGKGISACLYSLSVRSMLRSYATSLHSLSDAIRAVNELLRRDTGESGMFVTAWVGLYDMKTAMLHYTSCGHPAALLKRKEGGIQELSTSNPALGVVPFHHVESASIELRPGDTLFLYTDGILEAHNPQMKIFGKEKLYHLVSQPFHSSQELVDSVLAGVDRFVNGAAQHDDLTLLAMRLHE
jgi:sigma-B regulation protein RsbU (phosphoserine phosphatase)